MAKHKNTATKITRTQAYKKINSLTERDYNALLSIYNFRCLTSEQLFNLHYKYTEKNGEKKENDTRYFKKKLSLLLEVGLISEMITLDKNIPMLYKLTTKGINLLKKQFQWEDNIYDEKGRKITKGYLVESELNIKEKFAGHQYHLNNFVLKLKENLNIEFNYEDERHINSFVGIRPDGILTTATTTYFLEMDMGTENLKQLQEKWNHYREFLTSNEFLFKKKKIKILFIVDGVKNITKRINLIKVTVNKHFIDCFDTDIELYINTEEKLLEFIESETNDLYDMNSNLIQNALENKFKIISNQDKIQKHFNNTPFSLFARQNINNKNYDYLIENFENESMTSIYKACFFDKITNQFKTINNTNIRLILVCENLDIAYNNYNVFELDNCLFTTFDRLFTLPFNEAIVKFDRLGNFYNFQDNELTIPCLIGTN